MKKFLSNSNLYDVNVLIEEYTFNDIEYTSPYGFIGKTFTYFCDNEKTDTTFELQIEKETEEFYGKLDGISIPENCKNKDGVLNFTFKAKGLCQSCKGYEISLLINVFSLKPLPVWNGALETIVNGKTKEFEKPTIYIQKVGILPQIKITPDKEISKFFDRESNNWYYKGINCINEKYGIGSLAYFRRIIEKELINIIKDIKDLPDSQKNEIEKLLAKHNENPTVSTIYENIFEFLPNSLKVLGDNPIKLLYNQTSGGLHSFSEEESLLKSNITVIELCD